MSGTHAPFAPSGLSRILACPGSYSLAKRFPEDEESPAAQEGTAAHWVASEYLMGRVAVAGELAPNGVAVSDEMLDGAEMYSDALASYRAPQERIEQELTIPRIHPQCYGTPDYSVLQGNRIVVADYKFGHRHVEVFENTQLMVYAAGMMFFYHGEISDLTFEFIIVQPRSYHRDGTVRKWVVSATDLFDHWDKINQACLSAESPVALCKASSNCADCPASHACEAFQRTACAALDVAGRTSALELSPQATSLELQMVEWAIERLSARRDGLTEQTIVALRNGGIVPGYTLVNGSGRERWVPPAAEVVALGALMGVDISKPGVLTPKQAVKAGLPASLVSKFTETPSTGLKLVKQDAAQLRRIFAPTNQLKVIDMNANKT